MLLHLVFLAAPAFVQAEPTDEPGIVGERANPPTLDIGGRFDVDLGLFAGGGFEDAGLELDDGASFRRARSDVRYRPFGPRFEIRGHWDLADGSVELKDGWFDFAETGLGDLRLGYFREPFGIEAMTATKFTTYGVRSTPTNAFTPGRNTGATLRDRVDDRWSWAVGVFTFSQGLARGITGGDLSWVGRLTWLPVDRDDGSEIVHVGIGLDHRGANDGVIEFAARPGVDPADPAVDTGPIAASSADILGLEAAWIHGPVSFQSELFLAMVDADAARDPDFWGGYFQASWFTTGEHREYDREKSSFRRVTPSAQRRGGAGSGALELKAKVSFTDLDDEDVTGGQLTNLGLGANWHWTRNTRWVLDYIHSRRSGSVESGSANLVLLRYQIDF